MPLLEINQLRHICASVRLDETTAAQVDQYAAFIHASADDVVDKALNYVFSKDRDFQDFLKTPHARQVLRLYVSVKERATGAREARENAPPTWRLRLCANGERRDPPFNFVARTEAVLRTGRILTLHP